MFYDFLQYAYTWHSGSMLLMLIAGVASGILSSLKRKKKSAIIFLHVLVWLCIIYPSLSSTNYLKYHQGVLTCSQHSEYIMVRDTCYKPVNTYVPYNTPTINNTVGDAVKETTK